MIIFLNGEIMDYDNDPLGLAVKDYFLHGINGDINVFSDIAEPDVIPVEYLFRNFDEMPVLEQKALKLADGKVLDVGAAAGSHSLWLQENGIDVTALEISKSASDIIVKRGVKKVINRNFFEFKEGKYDTILVLMNGTGIAGTVEKFPDFLAHCKSLLNKNGKVLLDSSDISYMFDEGEEIPVHYYGEVKYIMEYKNVRSGQFDWLFLDYDSLEYLVKMSGGKCKKVAEGNHYDYLAEIKWD